MKKLMIAMAAVAMVGAANAAVSYAYDVYVQAYTAKDTNPSNDHGGWYSYYGMTQATAQDLLGKTTAVTYSDVAKWLGNNFAENRDDLVEAAQALTDFNGYTSGTNPQYRFMNFELGCFERDNHIGVVLFDNGTDLAYNVLSGDGMYFSCNVYSGSSSSGWQAVENVPEPTSGLLMLLGMAGLALKRKRA